MKKADEAADTHTGQLKQLPEELAGMSSSPKVSSGSQCYEDRTFLIHSGYFFCL